MPTDQETNSHPTENPKKQQRPVVVTAAIIRRGQGAECELLIAQRNADAKVEAGKWEFAGGKVDFGEHPKECLHREIREELDIEIEIERLYEVVSHVYKRDGKEAHIVLLCYLCTFKSGTVRHLDVADSRWISFSEIDSFDFALADLPIIAQMKAARDFC